LLCSIEVSGLGIDLHTSLRILPAYNKIFGAGYAKHQSRLPPTALLACLHDQDISGFFRGPAFIQSNRAI